jgi:hypothetical protein
MSEESKPTTLDDLLAELEKQNRHLLSVKRTVQWWFGLTLLAAILLFLLS